MNYLKALADNSAQNSLATRLRKKRFRFFLSLVERLPRPISILDVGGTAQFWEQMGWGELHSAQIMLANVVEPEAKQPGFHYTLVDGRSMPFHDGQFDVVFSNSVIEHVGNSRDQQQFAHEVRRVGKRFFIQTPNYYFPLEPHFLFPGFQFLPLSIRTFLLQHLDLGWTRKISDQEKAREVVTAVRLLTSRELRVLFPGSMIYRERFLGITKSLIAYGGWEHSA